MKNASKTRSRVNGIFMLLFFLVIAGLSANGAGEGYPLTGSHRFQRSASFSASAQQSLISVSGIVTDQQNQPLPGVSIAVKGTSTGTISDANGAFSLSNIPENAILVFSFVGMKTREIPVAGKTTIRVSLQEETVGLGEVVAIGYGTQKKVNLTGAVGQVTSDKLVNRPVPNLNAALEGLAPGLNITPSSSYGGEPGAAMDFNIRGTGSLSGGSPYVLVDGVPMDINKINPNDVASISILKDASSAAIYGAKASFGVILITTKMGKKDEKVTATYSNSFRWSAPTTLPEFVNSLDFANAMNEASVNAGQAPLFKDEIMERIKNHIADPENFPALFPDPNNPRAWGYWELSNGNTDWYDVYYKDLAFSQNHDIGIRGGSQNTTYYIGFGYMHEGGKLNYANDQYRRYNITSNISSDITKWMTLKLNIRIANSYFKYPKGTEGLDRTVVYHMFSRQWPTEPVVTPNGDFTMNLSQVPNMVNGGHDKKWDNDFWLIPSVEFRVTKDWKINADFNYTFSNSKRSDLNLKISGFEVDGVTPVDHYANNYTSIREILSNQQYYSSNVYSTFEKKLGSHFVSLLAGGQSELNKYTLLEGYRRDLVTGSVPSISTATGDYSVNDDLSHWANMGAFTRFMYNYREKYLLEFNARYDGSSKFQSGERWGFFPSASAGYVISKEDFWEPLNTPVSFLKLRASYGSLGNQNVANYLYAEILPINTNLNFIMDGVLPVYTTVPGLISSELTWETSNTIDFGLDAALLDNRLDLSFDWYKRTTKDMFGPGEALPALLGTDVPQRNNASLETKGFELSVGWKQTVSDDLKYEARFMLADSKSVVTEYNNPTGYIYTYYKGQVLGDIWGYESKDLFRSDGEASSWIDQSFFYPVWKAGDVKYIDQDGDEKITNGTQTLSKPGDLKVIGNSSPRYTYGLDLNVTFKRFTLRMFWQGVGKRDAWITATTFWGFTGNQYSTSLQGHNRDYWSTDNTDAYFPKPYMSGENAKNQQVQSRYLQDASYLRLKNLTLSYDVPGEVLPGIGLPEVRLFLTGENLLTFSKIIDPFDPEGTVGAWGDGKVYPLSKTFSFGVNVTF
ncbi:MAG: SusC/RagA family TonB-linked outer membrane protein [Mangrovibacterium sp.]